ncbi:MAG: hypothetical protein A3H72_03950 [Candidatus Doudnabacteria bacterium RIFCSPLOWO2_02_FULL_48_8]|uniref:Transcriptional repressor PaaX-like central Cas2-like domain-containing protein n=1 Tax=Candidatus Doudnabacteria bacterium RIFCSPHIGHO2_01_FULL_46_24 TaxID=1817825 RepID=A0A1F5NVJ4_9BACT|nr:MAG: hypothetical protein A2720_02160 [Candidatus Doudnabacteria bacterium RIFCSPHIGHO2_01_FULL_46_24]OGE95151.1 MAG: hypothetical protein A3H72_03950 [Candidatus Doudnabacteria bacterium RIFCSPLOWO2_02_FULL_48_8]OGE95534.1 MAG: hypothetical protein A3E98_01840 [Candidatus Doudnabacteria bacterium RIFCSPHIGHO2_12_FULL_48_11]
MARVKNQDIAKAIICALGVAALIVVAIAAPNAVQVFAQFYKPAGRFNKRQIAGGLYYLKSKKIIGIGQEGGKTVIKLTQAGKAKLLKYKLEDMKMSRPKKWDRKWRMVMFDIPEKYKVNRTVFVEKLKELGFAPMQKSVWVWPYDCEDETDFLKEMYEIRPFVKLAVAERLEGESYLLKKFGLLS